MDFNQYSALALRTANTQQMQNQLAKLDNAALGLAGESGEIADHIKKHLYQGHPLDIPKLAKEAGDALWYLNLLADALGIPLEVLATMNIKKLEARFPGGVFSAERSMNRHEELE